MTYERAIETARAFVVRTGRPAWVRELGINDWRPSPYPCGYFQSTEIRLDSLPIDKMAPEPDRLLDRLIQVYGPRAP